MLSWRTLAAIAAAATVWAFALSSGTLTNLRSTTKAELAQSITLPAPKDGITRPLIAIVADNAGTETTDFLVPLGILRAAGVADVVIVSTSSEPVTLMPALTVLADLTFDDFTAAYPAGADIVIVPALHDPNTPAVVDWLKQQHAQGATVMTICEGAWVAAAAGVLDGKRATTHWYALNKIARKHPATTWIRDARYVIDGSMISTTGVSASIPAALLLVEAIGGTEKASATAAAFGLTEWGPSHRTADFAMPMGMKLTAANNVLGFWGYEKIDMPVAAGVDEVSLALQADAWSRTYRSRALAVSDKSAVHSKTGVIILTTPATANHLSRPLPDAAATDVLDQALLQIATRYGAKTAAFVQTQLEY